MVKNEPRSTNPSKTIFFQGLWLIVLLGIVLSSSYFYLVLPHVSEVKSVYSFLPISSFLISCVLPYISFLIIGSCMVGFCKSPSRKFQIIVISAGTVFAVLLNQFFVYLTLMVDLKSRSPYFLSGVTNAGMLGNLVIIDIAIYFNRFEEFI